MLDFSICCIFHSVIALLDGGGRVRFMLKRRTIAHHSSYRHGFPPRSWRKYFGSSLWFGRKMLNDEDISPL